MDSVSNVGVVDKTVAVLRALEATGPAGLAELQAATGLPRATAHRLATALEQHGLVRRDPDGRFCLGLGLVALGRAAADGFPLAELARPGARRAARRDGRERAAVRPRGRRPALRRVAAVGARPALDRRRGRPAAAASVGSAGKVLDRRDRTGRLGRERRGARTGRGVGQRARRRTPPVRSWRRSASAGRWSA